MSDEVFGVAGFAGSLAGSLAGVVGIGLGISFGASVVGTGVTVPGTGGNAQPPAAGTEPMMKPLDAYEVQQGAASQGAGAQDVDEKRAFNFASNPGLDDAQGSHDGAAWAKTGRLSNGVPQGVPQPGDGKGRRAFNRANKPGVDAHGSQDTTTGAGHGVAHAGSDPAIHAELMRSNAAFTGCNLHNNLSAGIRGVISHRVATR